VEDWAKKNGLESIAKNKEELCKNPKIINLIRQDIDRLANEEKLGGFEKVKRFKLIPNDFTIENGLLTTTMKLKRYDAKNRFQDIITELYTQIAPSKL